MSKAAYKPDSVISVLSGGMDQEENLNHLTEVIQLKGNANKYYRNVCNLLNWKKVIKKNQKKIISLIILTFSKSFW